jgi:hypothetical protein
VGQDHPHARRYKGLQLRLAAQPERDAGCINVDGERRRRSLKAPYLTAVAPEFHGSIFQAARCHFYAVNVIHSVDVLSALDVTAVLADEVELIMWHTTLPDAAKRELFSISLSTAAESLSGNELL